MTLGSRVLGFVREVQSAALFGSASSLQTALTESDADRGDAAGRALFLATIRITTLVLIAICVAASAVLALTPRLVESGLLGEPEGAATVVELAVRFMPFLVMICLAALSAGALQVRGHFFTPALGPIAMNVVWILAPALGPIAMNVVWILALAWIAITMDGESELDQLRFLCWGVLAAGAAQLAVQVPALRRHGLLGSPLEGSTREGWKVLRASAPFALGAAAYQINVLIDGLMAEALLPDGGPTAHYYANRVQQLPLALIAVAATSSVFPAFKALGHLKRLDELRALHDRTQLSVLFLALPSAVGLAVLAEPIGAALFEHGAFQADGTARLAKALAVVALALPAAGAIGLTSRLYYSLGDIRTPVRISIAALVLNTALNFLFLLGFKMDVEGLAAATVISSCVNWLLLLPGLRGRLGLPRAERDLARRVGTTALAATASGAGAWGAARGVASIAEASLGAGTLADVATVVAGIAAGAGAFGAVALGLRAPELELVLKRFRA
ncbi:MAG: lipid II flippase MurJ [Planctomycetota bacterium]|jgi:putative peptidoglycan lipid II flippase